MSVENMTMMNIIGNIWDVDKVLKSMLLSNKIDLVSAQSQIEDNSFLFNVKDENIEKVIDLNNITSFDKDDSYEDLLKKGEEIKTILGLVSNKDNFEVDLNIDSENIAEELNHIFEELKVPVKNISSLKLEIDGIQKFYKNIQYANELTIPIEDLRNLKYFNFKFGVLSKEDRIKLKKNYENILAVILHTGSSSDGDAYVIIYPTSLVDEMDRILRSLNFKELMIPEGYKGTPLEIKKDMEIKQKELEKEVQALEQSLNEVKNEYKDRMLFLLDQVKILSRLEEIKEKLVRSKRFFYLSGWVAENDKPEMEEMLKKYDDTLIVFKSDNELTPPTRLKNNWLFKPFESLVKMYGMPSYNEIDPTPFLSLSYMFLFGAMFGDLGQGFVLLIGGFLLGKKNKMFGGLLSRLGVSSMIFGALYGAVFGFEHLLPAILIKPFENINTVLIAAIVIGIILILISYVFGMINSWKRKDIEEGIFGKEGLAGFLFYLTLLALAGGKVLGRTIIPTWLGVIIIILCLVGLIFRVPLTHLIIGKRPLHGNDITGYYIESVFSLLETLLSMLSGTISFIRVGAFALTHVGLFLAFETIGKMIGNPAANIVVLIIGNIIIIGLEGLIVLIQGLRLQYYELFSRYYKGEGREFNPVGLNTK